MSPSRASTQLRFSIIYFAISLCHGVTLAFFPLHCSALNFSALQIAAVSAGSSLAMMVGGPVFSALAHHYLAPKKVVFWCSIIGCILYVPLLFLTSFKTLFPVWLAFLLCYSGTSILVDIRAVRDAAAGKLRFERARLWGSIGFMVSLAAVGAIVDLFGWNSIVWVGFIFACILHVSTYAVTGRMPAVRGAGTENAPPHTSDRSYWKPLLLVLAATALLWASHGAYYVYFSIYLKALGWSGKELSIAWNVGVLTEVVFFVYFARIEKWLSLKTIFICAGILTVIRWFVLAVTSDPLILVLIQTFHAFSFGAIYLSSIRLVQAIAPPHYKERAQGLLGGYSSGCGSLLGRILFGYFAASIPVDTDLYLLFWPAVSVAAAGTLLAIFVRYTPFEVEHSDVGQKV